MDPEDKCTSKGCTEKKECGNYCVACYILNEFPCEDSQPPDEQNSKEANDQLGKEETLAAVNAAADEPQVEQTARQVPRANENGVVVEDANALPPECPKIFEQESTSVGFSYFDICPASDGICENQSVAIQDQITDSTVESAVSVSRSEPEPSTSACSGQKRKRNANTDFVEAKKRKTNENQEKKRNPTHEGVCQVCNGREYDNIYTHLRTHKNRAQQSEDQDEKNYTHKIENKNGVKTLVRVPKPMGRMSKRKSQGKCSSALFVHSSQHT